MYKWTCPKCSQVFTGGSREALENRANSHLENKHNDTSASVNIEKTNDAAYFPATDKTLADINRANYIMHDSSVPSPPEKVQDENFGPYAVRVQQAMNAWKKANVEYEKGNVGSSAVRSAAEKYDKMVRIARGQESEE